MKQPLLLAVLVSGLALSSLASASSKSGADVFQPGMPLLQQIERIEIALNDGETYSELSQDGRGRVREALSRLRGTAERFPNRDAMPESARTELFNDQQVVNMVLTQAREDSRLICRREKALGSHMATTQCMTVAERARQKDKAQRDMGQAQRVGKFGN
ncbi:hypothetical protein [Stenotrophomonas sp. 24(2023)]|uniref:hypothetical protein n=1 Tax=Stenotrophomonas sp. 24(2023) TaxID=3068324 RepID=UPI0027E1702E|nr:hypothetical protein [Stenotrophomonas sp. 24(2023)]WMJ70294.1 hypothetical protein Q9R17_04085 [Stenotrophomonas sp. 24(2023)]